MLRRRAIGVSLIGYVAARHHNLAHKSLRAIPAYLKHPTCAHPTNKQQRIAIVRLRLHVYSHSYLDVHACVRLRWT
jgi:hypothetical protein